MFSSETVAGSSRRDYLRTALAWSISGAVTAGVASASGSFLRSVAYGDEPTKGAASTSTTVQPKRVAAVVTVYRPNSHADVILTKILQGWRHDGGPGPALQLASLYIDQPESSEFGIELSRKHGVPIFDSIEKAVCVGGESIPVDGVLSIGEHGTYPHNGIGQQLYPRRRFMEEIAATFEKRQRVAPVFNDKHLGPVWKDALWMYDRARALKIPYMAGSSLPVGFRTVDLDLPLASDIDEAVGIGYGGVEAYGFHALEMYQCHVERRRGGERGVKSVRFLEGSALAKALDDGVVSPVALQAALDAVPKKGPINVKDDKRAGLFLFDYVDGFRGAVLHLSTVQGTSIGLKLKGESKPLATAFGERTEPRYPHFAYLLKAIEQMIHTGKPTYPVERTLLTSGILDRCMNSRARGGDLLLTPELEIAYQPVQYPHAPHVDLLAPVRRG
jgi:hypothetical protein